ncbi:MAG: type I restriction enzyme HsdR N-terminal domain-containing protein [Ferruginibacter sp.]
MIEVVYPELKPAVKVEDGKEQIFCIIRKRWLIITPEEWVRQNFLLFLTGTMGYPASLIAVEKQVSVTGMNRRFDIVVFNQQAQPFMIVECKEMNVKLTEEVLSQVLRYNTEVSAGYLVITNGSYTRAFENQLGNFKEIDQLPTIR